MSENKLPSASGFDPSRGPLLATALERVSYWNKRIRAEKCFSDCYGEDGFTYTPMGDNAAFNFGYCQGRHGEAEWWLETIKANTHHLTDAAKKLAFYIDGIGGAATPTGEVLRKIADDLTGKRTIENREGWARCLYSRADLLEEAAAEIRKLVPADPAQSPSTSDGEG